MIDPLTENRKTHETKPQTIPESAGKTSSREAPSQETLAQETVSQDTLSDLFQDRDQGPLSERNSPTAPKASEERRPPQEEDFKSAGVPKKEDDKKSPENIKKEDTQLELQRLQEDLEKTHKRLTENQQYGRQNAQRLKNALKVAKEFVEEGSLTEEEATKLLGTLESDAEEDVSSYPSHPFGKVLATANKELENIRKYTDDDLLDDKVGAFDYFLLVASQEERDQALKDLNELLDNPLALAKKMLSIGHDHEKSYRDMKAAGGIQGMISKKDQDIDNLRKSIDKLNKKLAQYEDYDKPRYRIDDHVGDHVSETGESEDDESSKDTITSLFSHRDAVRSTVRQR